jgi:hypothetical protein
MGTDCARKNYDEDRIMQGLQQSCTKWFFFNYDCVTSTDISIQYYSG